MITAHALKNLLDLTDALECGTGLGLHVAP